MPGLVPGIHVLSYAGEAVDGRVKPGHDERRDGEFAPLLTNSAPYSPTLCCSRAFTIPSRAS
jgi:hypothetical protein